MEYDNPADRLLNIIKAGKQIAANENCRRAWQRLLGTEDEATLLSRIGKVVELPRQIIQTLQENNPKGANTWSHWYPQVVGAFGAQQLNANWQSFIGSIDHHSLTQLELSAQILQMKTNTSVVESSQLDDLKAKLTEMFKEVRDSADINPLLKKKICAAIQKIIASIDEYMITGIDGVSDAVEAMAGSIAINPNVKIFVKKEGIGKRLLGLLKTVNDTVATAQDVKEFSDDVAGVLDWVP